MGCIFDENLRGFLLLTTILQSRTEILRLKCATYANFSVIEAGKKLESTFLTIDGIDKLECQYECILDDRCKTININEDHMICELNNKSSEDIRDNIATVHADGWTYYSTRYYETLVGSNCISKKPCEHGWRCYDQCECPGYYCTGMKSCMDWYRAGSRVSGRYSLVGDRASYPVFCDFESESNSVWTLVMSFSRRNVDSFREKLFNDQKKNDLSPNWASYRLGLPRMKYIRSSSTMWRVTCSFLKYKSDIYRDYVRAQISEIDIITFNGLGSCRMVDYINIRGQFGTNVTVPFWQGDSFSFHTDSTEAHCEFNAKDGSIGSEDNFGLYWTYNNEFRCTESEESTTQYWFGISV